MEPNGCGTSKRIGGRRRWNSWISITAASTCGVWDAPYAAKPNRRFHAGSNLCGINCAGAKNKKPCARWRGSGTPRAKPARSFGGSRTPFKAMRNGCATSGWPAADGRLALARSNRLVGRSKPASNVAGSSGPNPGSATSAHSMKPAATTTGTNFGPPTKDSVKMHSADTHANSLHSAFGYSKLSS